MIVYRVGKSRFAHDLSGEGARLFGGRWNYPLTPCIYTSGSRALAILEYSVNVNIHTIPRALSITCIEIPDTGILQLQQADLPGNWKEMPAPFSTREFGTGLLQGPNSPIIEVPSAIVPEEVNYLLNPLHPLHQKCKILSVKDFVYDVRIKMV